MMESTKFSNKLFNTSIFKMHVKRYWPFWVVLALLWIYIMPFLMFLSLGNADGTNMLYRAKEQYCFAANNMPVLAMLTSIFVAMAVFNYIMNKERIQFMHSLPVTKAALFVTNYITGLIVMLSVYAFAGILCILVCRFYGLGVMWGAFGLYMYSAVACTIFFYSFSVFVVMIAGQILAAPVYYFILNFAAPVLGFLISFLMYLFMFGYDNGWTFFEGLNWFSPIIKMSGSFA
ncbi:MAG: hypothetical protein K6G40_06865, partial [Eubacterium sp.]|nr:hypothetical protein [Eubacterium sp.]